MYITGPSNINPEPQVDTEVVEHVLNMGDYVRGDATFFEVLVSIFTNDPALSFISVVIILIFLSVVWIIIEEILKKTNPFHDPRKVIEIDVSGRRAPKMEDVIDEYINHYNYEFLSLVEDQDRKMEHWGKTYPEILKHSIFKRYRKKQLNNILCLLDREYVFITQKGQTRYKQVNYKRTPYQVVIPVDALAVSREWIVNRYKELAKYEFQMTLQQAKVKDQRKLMTRELRESIMVRDNYTCQCCGKYMPDEVGLQIDHVVPVSKGGKSIPSNLQVLCSVCNLSKSNK